MQKLKDQADKRDIRQSRSRKYTARGKSLKFYQNATRIYAIPSFPEERQ